MPKHFPVPACQPGLFPGRIRQAVEGDEIPGCSNRLREIQFSQNRFIETQVYTQKPNAIYVSNLHHTIDDAALNHIFRRYQITRSFIARDKSTSKSLGYGIVYFEKPGSVSDAIEKCSGLIYKEKPIKVEVFQTSQDREKARPFTNLFIKNFFGAFSNDSDLEELIDLFRPFGPITSWKMERDNGILKGFGFVCFQYPESALEAVTTLNGHVLPNGKLLYVAKHESKQQREMKLPANDNYLRSCQNGLVVPKYNFKPMLPQNPVTIVSLPKKSISENAVVPPLPRVANSQVAPVTTKFLSRVSVGTSYTKIPPATYSSGFRPSAPIPSPAATRHWKNNIYVKNILGFIDTDEELSRVFSRFGKIISAVVMKDNFGISKGFGFVCFEDPLHAQTAIRTLHLSRLSNGKLLYCGEAQKKEERQVELRNKFRLIASSVLPNTNLNSDLCNICYTENNPSECVMFDCRHVNCKACLTDWFTVLINERQVNSFLCLGENCTLEISPTLVKSLVSKELYETYDKILLENFLATQSDIVHCPTPGCDAFIELDYSEPTRGHCDLCGVTFCTNCNDTYHGLAPCDEIENDTEFESILRQYVDGTSTVKQRLEQRYGEKKLKKGVETQLTNPFITSNCKQCPNCNSNIEKNGGCNHMECFRCKIHFCWKCLKTSTTSSGIVNHFRHPDAPGTSTSCETFG